jgi:co-chaperonin GroES (HSP10)
MCFKNPVFDPDIPAGTASYEEKISNLADCFGLKPCIDRILILPYTIADKTTGGIALAGDTRSKENRAIVYGVVIALGEYAYNECNPQVKPGDHVKRTRYAGEWTDAADGTRLIRVTDRMIDEVMDPGVWAHLKNNEETFFLPVD